MRRRILSSMVAVTALAVLLFGVPLAIAAGRLYHSQEMTRLERKATVAARILPASDLLNVAPEELRDIDRRAYLGVYDPAGGRVVGRGPAVADAIVRQTLTGKVTQGTRDNELIVGVPIVDDRAVVGAARAAVPAGVVATRTRVTWAAMAGLGLVALLIAAIAGRRQARRLAEPVQELARSLSRLGDGDFSVRTPMPGIPELDSAAAALAATAVRLGDLVERERAFSADASHQLSTPLTGLRLTLEGALMTPGTDFVATVHEALEEVDRLQATIADLLALARGGRNPGAPIDLRIVVGEAEQAWRGRLAERGRGLRVEVDSLPAVRGSAAATRQILNVLLDNAVSHGRGTVTIRAQRAGNGAVVEVEDEGPGLAGDPSALFERGSSSGGERHGIGLPLACRLAEAEGARLLVRRARPHAVFALALPSAAPR